MKNKDQAKNISNMIFGKERNDNMFYVQMKNGVSYMINADEMNTMDKDQITFHKDGEMVGLVRTDNVEMVFKDIQPKLI